MGEGASPAFSSVSRMTKCLRHCTHARLIAHQGIVLYQCNMLCSASLLFLLLLGFLQPIWDGRLPDPGVACRPAGC